MGRGGTGGPANDMDLSTTHSQEECSISFCLGGIAGKAGASLDTRDIRGDIAPVGLH